MSKLKVFFTLHKNVAQKYLLKKYANNVKGSKDNSLNLIKVTKIRIKKQKKMIKLSANNNNNNKFFNIVNDY